MEKLIEYLNDFKGVIKLEFIDGHIIITTNSTKIILSTPKIIGVDSTG
jgi:hypothetical protein